MKLKTNSKKFKVKLRKIKKWILDNRHMEVKELIKKINLRLVGHYRYYGVSDNIRCIHKYFFEVRMYLFKALNKRSQRKSFDWNGYEEHILNKYFIAKPKIYVDLYLYN